jgi:hypothetical protein
MVAMLGVAILSTVMISWFGSVTAVDARHFGDDVALEQLRDIKERFSKDVRGADEIQVAEAHLVQFWVDSNRDGIEGVDEYVVWSISSTGDITRADCDGSRLETSNADYDSSYFGYDASDPADVTRVSMQLLVVVEGPGVAGTREIATEVALRNI